MIVFVLGAGASKPYGYPTGYELRTKLIKFPATTFNNTSVDLQLYHLLGNTKPATAISNFKNLYYDSGLYSIDHFLSNNESYDKIGKVMIAHSLIGCEYKSQVRDLGENENQNWMQYLYNIFISRIIGDEGIESLLKKPFEMAFITFNYDRSLEYFLFSAIYALYSDYFNNHKDDFLKIQEKITIHHMYGSINKKGINYGMLSDENALEISNNIHIIHDANRKDNSQKSRELLEQADNIVFLGFGYDEYNIINLLNEKDLSNNMNKNIIGSVYKMSRSEVSIKSQLLQKYFGEKHNLNSDDIDLGCKDFLRKYARYIPIL